MGTIRVIVWELKRWPTERSSPELSPTLIVVCAQIMYQVLTARRYFGRFTVGMGKLDPLTAE
jgi:hypothetical protein